MSQCLYFPTYSPDRIRDRHLRTSIQASAHLVSVSFLEQFHQSILLQELLFMVQRFLPMPFQIPPTLVPFVFFSLFSFPLQASHTCPFFLFHFRFSLPRFGLGMGRRPGSNTRCAPLILRTNAGSGAVSQSRTFNFILLGSSDEKSEQLPRKKDLAHIRIRTSSVAMNRNKIESSMQIELNFVGVESKGSCSSNILRLLSFRTQRLTRKQDRPHYKFSRVFASAKFGHFPRIPEIFHLRFHVCLCDMLCDLNDKSLWSSQTQDLEWKTFPLQNNSVLILST